MAADTSSLERDRERFLTFVWFPYDANDCWSWRWKLDKNGRPIYEGKTAARMAYLLFVGDLQDDMDVHHECEIRWCVSPLHLVQLTKEEHHLRHTGIASIRIPTSNCGQPSVIHNLKDLHVADV